LPEHIAERVRRLELSTRFRPFHIGVLFVVLAPPQGVEYDFYGPFAPETFSDPLLNALKIPASSGPAAHDARLAEFQHRGYHLAYVSECPIPAGRESAAETLARLAPTLVRRIRFNYRPKQVAPLGMELLPLVATLQSAGISPVLAPDHGQLLPVPGTGGGEWLELFERTVASAARRENLSAGV
jgi:hypothetical protein